MNSADGTSTNLRVFGGQLRWLRTEAGLTRAELGDRIGYSESMVSMVEQGKRIPKQDLIDRADDELGARGVLKAAAPFLAQERYPAWFQDFASLEPEVVTMYSYENQVVPGVLQTEEYARAVISARCPPLADEDIEGRVGARMDRQGVLTRVPAPVLGFVIEEVVLRRPIGGPAAMKSQLLRLLECASMRHVSLQVMPTRQETHSGLDGPMVLLETPERRNLAYVEGQSGSVLVSDRDEVSVLTQRYGIIRAQALTPEASANLIQGLAGEL